MALTNDFYKKLDEEYRVRMLGAQPQSPVVSTPPPAEPGSFRTEETPVRIHGDISKEEQIQKFGGVVGSPEYYKTKAGSSPAAQLLKRTIGPIGAGAVGGFLVGGPIGAVFGAGAGGGIASNLMPPQEVWDKMSTTDKIIHIGYRSIEFPVKLATGIPEFFIKSVPNIVSQVSRPFREGVAPTSLQNIEKLAVSEVEKPDKIPGIGELDPLYGTMLKEYTTARQNGWSDNVSTVYAYAQGGRQILDYAIASAMFAKGIQSMVRPPKKLAPGEKVANIGPIEEQLRLSEEKLMAEAGIKTKDGPASIYISTEKSYSSEVAAKTGRSGQAVIKITPAGNNSVKVSLVQLEGLVGKIKSRFGLGDEGGVQGARGKEFEVESQIVKIEPKATKQVPIPKDIQSAKEFVSSEILGEKSFKQMEDFVPTNFGITETGKVIPKQHDFRPYGKYVYHETSPQNARVILDELSSAGPIQRKSIAVTNTPELALGQGGKGIRIIFDSTEVRGMMKRPELQKPTAGFLHRQGKTDELIAQDFGRKAVIGIEAPANFKLSPFSRAEGGEQLITSGTFKRLGLDEIPIITPEGKQLFLRKEIKSQLTDFYNQATKGIKSAEEFVGEHLRAANQTKLYQEIRQLAREIKTPEQIKKAVLNEFGTDPEITLYRGINQSLRPSPFESDITSKVGRFWTSNKAHAELFVRENGKIYELKIKASDLLKARLNKQAELSEEEIRLSNELQQTARESLTKSQLTDFYNQEVRGVAKDVSPSGSVEVSVVQKRITPISEPYAGSENRPITRKQVDNIYLISEVGGFEPAVTDMIIQTLTGKRAVGELTNAEYVNVAKTLSETNRLGEFSRTGQASLWTKWVGQYVSPPRSWMESVQRKTGVPIYDTWLDLENGYRLSRTYAQAFMDETRKIFGDYAGMKFTNERRLVDAHMRGDQNAIVNNPNLTPQVKADLLKIVDAVSNFFEQHGPALGVEKQYYKKNDFGYYLPDVIDIGGIIERYKAVAAIPTGKEFFATKQKRGGNYIRVDDPMKLMDIYARQGSEAKFLNDPFGRAHALQDKVPSEFRTSYRSAVLEKMGYEGRFTKFLDDVISRISQKLGIRLPGDAGRKLNQSMLSYAYINALDSPTTWLRNVLMNNVLLYTKFGPEFLGQAALKGFSSEGLAEVRSKGFLNETSQAFGADIGTAAGKVKQVAEIGLAPVGLADSTGRGTAYFATRSHFENAIKLYNEGKISWAKAEKMLDLDGMSPIEANRVRAALKARNMDLAFNEMVRSVIDETNFPYRRGSSARITYGGAGNILTFLYKWNIEFLHTTGRWIRTGQWDKIFRYYAASTVTIRALKDAYGLDFTSSVGFGPLEQRYPASIKIGLDFINMLQSVQSGNAEALDDAHEELTRALKTFGIPGGVDTKNWQDFWRSYSKGPDRNGKFSIIGPRGDLLAEGVPFSELYARLWGLPTVLKTETGKAERRAIGYQFEVAQAKRKVAELRNAGKNDDADALVAAWDTIGEDIEPDRKSYDRFERPRTERIFEKLPPGGKELFESDLLK